MPTLEFVGSFHPFDETRGGIDAFISAVRKQAPGISNAGINAIVKQTMDNREYKRVPGWIVHRFGLDIMTADPTHLPAWRWMYPGWRDRVLKMPVAGGAVLDGDAANVQRHVFSTLQPEHYNRASLISPAGLSTTYVWRAENDWLQEVTDADAAVLRAAKDAVFRDPSRFGRWVEPRAWIGQVAPTETYRFSQMDDIEAFDRDRTRTPHWAGVATTAPALAGKE